MDEEDPDKEDGEIEKKEVELEDPVAEAKRLKDIEAQKKRQHVYHQIQHAKMEMRQDLRDENFVYIEGSFGRYHRIKLIHQSRDP